MSGCPLPQGNPRLQQAARGNMWQGQVGPSPQMGPCGQQGVPNMATGSMQQNLYMPFRPPTMFGSAMGPANMGVGNMPNMMTQPCQQGGQTWPAMAGMGPVMMMAPPPTRPMCSNMPMYPAFWPPQCGNVVDVDGAGGCQGKRVAREGKAIAGQHSHRRRRHRSRSRCQRQARQAPP